MSEDHSVSLRCVARLEAVQPISEGSSQASQYYTRLQFTQDGTSIVAQRADHRLDTYVLPPGLLDDQGQILKPYSCGPSPSSLLSYDVHPGFALADGNTTWTLSSSVDLPIQMRNALSYDYTTISYPWISPTTEQYHSANSLLFSAQGSHFAAGSKGRLALFDVSRSNEGPMSFTAAGRHRDSYSEGLQDQGLVMALSGTPSGLLAAGTSTRNIVLLPFMGLNQPEAHFSLKADPDDPCQGSGVTSLAWSPCERYLIVAERQSNCAQVFDIRKGGARLSFLSGRAASSTQKFDLDVIQTADGFELWSGGTDGHVKMWNNPGSVAGEHLPAAELALDDRPISAKWHPSGAVLATCSGGRLPIGLQGNVEYDENDTDQKDAKAYSSLQIWAPG